MISCYLFSIKNVYDRFAFNCLLFIIIYCHFFTGRKNVSHIMGRTTHVDMNRQVEEIQIEQAEESIDSNPTEMIQLVCAGCMRPFESENHFQAHICTGQAT